MSINISEVEDALENHPSLTASIEENAVTITGRSKYLMEFLDTRNILATGFSDMALEDFSISDGEVASATWEFC